MAKRNRLDPDYEYPLSYRLAEFLLGGADALGDYSQGLGAQSKGASDVLESFERQDIARDTLAERRREADLKAADRDALLNERQASTNFLQQIGKQRGVQIPEGAAGASPQSLQWAIEYLTKADKEPALYSHDPEKDLYKGGVLTVPGQQKPPKPDIREVGGALIDTTDPAQPREVYRGPEKPPPTPGGAAALEVAIADANTPPDKREQYKAALANIRAAELENARNQGAISLGNQQTMQTQRDTLDRAQKADLAARELSGVDTLIGKMESLVPKVNTPGVSGRLAGVTGREAQYVSQSDPNVVELTNLGTAYVSIIAKVVQQQSGILSDQDLRRAMNSIPTHRDNLETAQGKIRTLREIVTGAQRSIGILRGGQPTTGQPSLGGLAPTPPASKGDPALEAELRRRGLIP